MRSKDHKRLVNEQALFYLQVNKIDTCVKLILQDHRHGSVVLFDFLSLETFQHFSLQVHKFDLAG